MLGRLGDLGAPQGAAPAACASASPAAWRSTCATRCASARRRSISWSGPTAIATCRRCSRRSERRSARRAAPRRRRDLRRPPVARERRRARLGHGHARLRPLLHVLHRALRARPRAQPARRPCCSSRCARPVDAGAREIVFLGQTVNAYRHDGWDFARLLRETAAVPGLLRHALHVAASRRHDRRRDRRHGGVPRRDAAAPPAGAVGLGSRARAHGARLHGRHATRRWWTRLRERVPGLALSTDVIVGFPGEDDDDFAATEALLRRVGYDSAFLFRYSAREGTRAASWTDDVPDDEKGRRLERLIALQETISAERNRALRRPRRRGAGRGTGAAARGLDDRQDAAHEDGGVPGAGGAGRRCVTVRVEAATSHTLTGRPASTGGGMNGRVVAASSALITLVLGVIGLAYPRT